MNKILLLAATSIGIFGVSAAAQAQAAPNILVVDTQTIMQTCNACKTAASQLESQANALQTRRNSLAAQFQPEEQAIQNEAKALNGKPAGPALKAKADSLQKREQQAQEELQNGVENWKSTQAHVQQQIEEKLVAVVEQVRARRAAAIAISKGATLANDNGVDVTGEVLASLNQQLPSVSVTPLPQQQQQQPQGR